MCLLADGLQLSRQQLCINTGEMLGCPLHACWLQGLADELSAPLQENVSLLCLCIANAL